MNLRNLLIFVLLCGIGFSAWWNATSASERAYYFIEHDNNGNPLSYGLIWIKGDFSSTQKTFYVYYNGNTEDTSRKNGKQVFKFFDEFEGTAINSTLWGPTGSVSGGIWTCSGTSMYSVPSNFLSTDCAKFYGKYKYSDGYLAYSGFRLTTPREAVLFNNNTAQKTFLANYNTGSNRVEITSYFTQDVWTLWEVCRNGSTSTFISKNNEYITRNTNQVYTGNDMKAVIGLKNVDYFFVVPVNHKQATITYGSEQSGSWELNNIIYTKRRQVSVSFPSTVTDQQVALRYNMFNSTRIAVTSYLAPSTIYNFTAYENTLQTFTFTTLDFNVATAYLEYNGVNYTATRINSTTARAQIRLPFVSTNATIRSFRWHVYNGTTWRAFSYRNQTIIWSNRMTATNNLPFVQHNTQTTINATITEFHDTQLNNSWAVLTFNGVNYTMTKVSDTKFTRTITMPTQTEFTKKYTYTIHYYTNTSLKRNQLSSFITGIKYSTPQLPCDNYLEQSGNYEKYSFKENLQYNLKSNSSNTCPNELLAFATFRAESVTNWCYVTDEYLGVNNGGAYSCQVTSPTITFQSHIPFIKNREITALIPVAYQVPCTSTFSGRIRIFNSSNSYIDLTSNGQKARWFLDNNTGDAKICIVGSNTCILTPDARYKLQYYFSTGGCSPAEPIRIISTSSLWIFNVSESFRQDIGRYVPDIRFSGAERTFSTPISYNYKTGEKYYIHLFRGVPNSQILYTPMLVNQFIINPKPSSSGIILRLGEQISNPYRAYVVTPNVQLIEPRWNIYIARNTYNMPHTIYYMRFNASTYVTTLYKDVATIIQDKYGICYFVPPYSPANLSATQTLTGYQIPCDSSISEIDSLPLMPSLQICRVQNNTYVMNLTYSAPVLFELYVKDNNVVSYSQSTGTTYNNKVSITPTTSEITLKVANKTRCHWSNNNALIGIGELPNNEWANKIIGYPLLIFTSAVSIYNPFLFIGAIAVNEFFKLVEITGLLLLAIAIGLFALISNWEGERTLKTLIILFLITGIYIVQLYAMAGTRGYSTEITTKISEISNAFTRVSNSNDIIQIITIAIPTFLINIVVLLLELPALIVSIIFDAIISIVPQLASPLLIFQNALIVGAYAWLVLKIYEIGRNTFRPI